MIIGKKQIVLASLVMILGVAIYLNWQFAQTGEDLLTTNYLEQLQQEEGKNYGDAQLVAAETDDYFASARLNRQKSREEATQTLKSIFESVDLSATDAQTAAAEALELTQLVESESKIENLVKAQGFADCLAYLDGETATVVVKTEGLDAAQAAQIKDIIVGEVDVDATNITITEVK